MTARRLRGSRLAEAAGVGRGEAALEVLWSFAFRPRLFRLNRESRALRSPSPRGNVRGVFSCGGLSFPVCIAEAVEGGGSRWGLSLSPTHGMV